MQTLIYILGFYLLKLFRKYPKYFNILISLKKTYPSLLVIKGISYYMIVCNFIENNHFHDERQTRLNSTD